MSQTITSFRRKVFGWVERHSLLVSALAIYAYYLLTTIDLFKHSAVKKSFMDYILQFDSLILMWIIASVVIQLQKYRKHHSEEEEYRKKVEMEFERQRLHLQLLDEITELLQDNVNNPLAVISITTHNIRRRFESDDEILAWLDRIDASLQRIHSIINDIKSYQTQKIVSSTVVAPLRTGRAN